MKKTTQEAPLRFQETSFLVGPFEVWFDLVGRALLQSDGSLDFDLDPPSFVVLYPTDSPTGFQEVRGEDTGGLFEAFLSLIESYVRKQAEAWSVSGRLDWSLEEEDLYAGDEDA